MRFTLFAILVLFSSSLFAQLVQQQGSIVITDQLHTPGCAWGDFNDDGFPDLMVTTRKGEPNMLYKNDQNGGFIRVYGDPVVQDYADSREATWVDFDNDGDLDLFVLNFEEPCFLYQNNGDNPTSKVLGLPFTTESHAYRSAAWGDYDNDGDLDLFIATVDAEPNLFYENQNNGSYFAVIDSGIIVSELSNARSAHWVDYNNDGWIDLFISNSGWTNSLLYTNNGDKTFTKVDSTNVITTEGGASHGASWGDINNDGWQDLIVANYNRQNLLYLSDGSGGFNKVTTGAFVTDTADSRGTAIFDIDMDGQKEIFIANRDYKNHPENDIYELVGPDSVAKFLWLILPTDTADSRSCAFADYDRDGRPDLYVPTGGGSDLSNLLYKNQKNGNATAAFTLRGLTNNTFGIGAKIHVLATISGNPVWQTIEVFSNTGKGGCSAFDQHFGLGDATVIDSIIVEWPMGQVCNYGELDTGRFMALNDTCGIFAARKLWLEPEQPTATIDKKDCDPIEIMVVPNPGSGDMNLVMNNLPQGSYQVSIFDVQGKEVYSRRLNSSDLIANNLLLHSKLFGSSGMYLVRVSNTSGFARSCRILRD